MSAPASAQQVGVEGIKLPGVSLSRPTVAWASCVLDAAIMLFDRVIRAGRLLSSLLRRSEAGQ